LHHGFKNKLSSYVHDDLPQLKDIIFLKKTPQISIVSRESSTFSPGLKAGVPR